MITREKCAIISGYNVALKEEKSHKEKNFSFSTSCIMFFMCSIIKVPHSRVILNQFKHG